MKADFYSDKDELIYEIKRLNKNIKARFSKFPTELRERSPAYMQYLEISPQSYNTSHLKTLDDQDLQNLLRDLKRVNSYSTSTHKGFTQYLNRFEPILNELEKNPELKDDFWKAYARAVEGNELAQKYKYNFMDFVLKGVKDGIDYEEISIIAIQEFIEEVRDNDKSTSILYTPNRKYRFYK